MKQLLKRLGANQKEVNTWLSLLELGAQPISVIAKHSGIPRTTMYLIIQGLKDLGLIQEFQRDGVKFVKCIPVKTLPDLMSAKRRFLAQTEEMLMSKLGELEILENKLSITPTVHFLEGKSAVSKMYEQVLKEKEFYACFNPALVKEQMPEYHFKIPETLLGYGGKAQELLVDCPEAEEYRKKYSTKQHQIKILPSSSVFSSDIIICSDKMYLIAYGENKISATEIISPSLVQTQRVLFELVWESI